jgi:nucleoid DNA-binding protein
MVQKRDIIRNFDKKNTLRQSTTQGDIANPTEKVDEANSKKVWEAFGAYVARNMKAGKGIHIPKFGQFTFTFPNHL